MQPEGKKMKKGEADALSKFDGVAKTSAGMLTNASRKMKARLQRPSKAKTYEQAPREVAVASSKAEPEDLTESALEYA